MFIILLCTIIGFLFGFAYVIKKRGIRPGKVLAATFLALLTLGIFRIFRDYYDRQKKVFLN